MAGDGMTTRDHEKAKAMVLDVLSEQAVGKIEFSLSTWTVKPQLYRAVAEAIRTDKIAVIHDPDLRKVKRGGVYVGTYDMLGVAAASIQGDGHQRLMAEQLIIHECTHAGFDFYAYRQMTHLEGEAAAYIAGCLYLVAKVDGAGQNAKAYRLDSPDPATRKIMQSALAIAKNAYYGQRMPQSLYRDLEAGLRESTVYRDIVDTIVENDGVGVH
jgi:hypothetical protein